MNGILCIDKPKDFTSFDVVAKLRGITRTRKIGHAGTLDPMATGVLPIYFGNTTKAIDLTPNHDKAYRATFRLGQTTDTLDCTGMVTATCESAVTWEKLVQVMASFEGEIEQIPPMYSAVKVDGRRLYDLARSGKEVERKPRKITISSLQLLEFEESLQTGVMDVSCTKGTYIRSLCDDIGRNLGVGAVLTALTRTQAGVFSLAQCLTLDEVQKRMDEGRLEQTLLPVEALFEEFPKIKLDAVQTRMFCNGVKLDLDRVNVFHMDGLHTVYGDHGKFIGLAQLDLQERELRIQRLFVG